MSKKKCMICAGLLYVIMIIAFFASKYLIKNDDGLALYDLLSPLICGLWIWGQVEKFYYWLLKDGDTK